MVNAGPAQASCRIVVEQPAASAAPDSLDLLLYAIGYEQRSLHVAQEWMGRYSRAIGIRFHQNEIYSFPNNLQWAASHADIQIESAESEIAIGPLLLQACRGKDSFSIGVDASSFPRTYLAEMVSALWRLTTELGAEVRVKFMYSVPEFTEPALEHGPVVSFGAVRPDFVGLSETGWSLATLIGLGYEPELALAAQQVLDPAITWLGVPRSHDNRFDDEVSVANEILLDVVDAGNIWSYDVSDPAATFVMLESIVSGLRRSHNVVLVAFGPKLFAISCLLVSLAHGKEIGIWRLSAGNFREPRDQFAAGPIHTLDVSFCGPRPST